MSYGRLVVEATHVLRQWLQASNLKPGTRLPPERGLAETLKLQHYAVNRAIARLIAEGIVQRDGHKLFLSPPRVTSEPFSCDLIVAQRSAFLRSYRKVAKDMGIGLTIHQWTCLEEAVEFLHQLDTPHTQSVLFDPPYALSAHFWDASVAKLLEHGVPVISMGQYSPKAPCILPDYARSVELAFSHLTQLGHQEIALATVPLSAPISGEILRAWNAQCQTRGLSASVERVFFQNNPKTLHEDARELAGKFMKEWSGVTAILVYGIFAPAIQQLVEELKRCNKKVPKDISLIFLSDLTHPHIFNPPISTVEVQSALMHETAFLHARRMAQKKEQGKLQNFAWCIRVEPTFILRASTAPIGSPPLTAQVPDKLVAAPYPEMGLGGKPVEVKEKLRMVRRQPYDLTSRAAEERFMSIDLTKLVNRPLNYQRGWLGDMPLKHLAAGRHQIHGIPFEILGGSRRTDYGAIVFRSTINTTANLRELPTELEVPIAARVQSIYFLHGCGYSTFLHPFATYKFYAGTKCVGTVPLVVLGQLPANADPETLLQKSGEANIQDWWADFHHQDFPHARRVPLLENEGEAPLHRHVYLYTLEWINPKPEVKISHVEVLVDPGQSTTLGLLAISALKK